MNTIFYRQPLMKIIIAVLITVLMVSGCSVIELGKSPYITEASIKSLTLEPIVLPSTKLPATSLEQAKTSYLMLLQNTKSAALIAESLQRLAEIETMIAENKLDQGQSEQMNIHLKLAADYYQQLLANHSNKIEVSKIQYQLASVLELDGQPTLSQNLLTDLAQLNEWRKSPSTWKA